MLIAALSILGLTLIAWPARAVVRWRYGAGFFLEGRAATAYRLIRIAVLFLLAWFAGWATLVVLMLSDLNNLDGSMDDILRALQFAAIIPAAALMAGIWNLGVVWTRNSSWFAKLWSVLLLLSIAGLIWIGVAGSLFNFSLAY